jgi:hypothetical protein
MHSVTCVVCRVLSNELRSDIVEFMYSVACMSCVEINSFQTNMKAEKTVRRVRAAIEEGEASVDVEVGVGAPRGGVVVGTLAATGAA